MNILGKAIIGVVVTIIFAGSIFMYLGYGLQNVTFEDLNFKGLRNIGLRSFTIEAELILHNPSDLSVPVRQVTYDIIQKSTGMKISSGVMPLFVLEANMNTAIPFEQEILWGPTSALALELATEDKVYLTVKGNAFLDIAGAREQAISFEEDVEVKQYLKSNQEAEEVGKEQATLPEILG
ncbi:hypothetical protein HYV86_01505 [Candidatus Woesearchaeota archaeon]|nr:hypothetical protein [Candidatus Woesearchaeota archaeon]